MTQHKKITIGVLTILPFLFFCWTFVNIFSAILGIARAQGDSGELDLNLFFGSLPLLIIPGVFAGVLSIGMLIYYIVDIASHNPKFQESAGSNKILWISLLLFTGLIGMLIYFFAEIYPREEGAYSPTRDRSSHLDVG